MELNKQNNLSYESFKELIINDYFIISKSIEFQSYYKNNIKTGKGTELFQAVLQKTIDNSDFLISTFPNIPYLLLNNKINSFYLKKHLGEISEIKFADEKLYSIKTLSRILGFSYANSVLNNEIENNVFAIFYTSDFVNNEFILLLKLAQKLNISLYVFLIEDIIIDKNKYESFNIDEITYLNYVELFENLSDKTSSFKKNKNLKISIVKKGYENTFLNMKKWIINSNIAEEKDFISNISFDNSDKQADKQDKASIDLDDVFIIDNDSVVNKQFNKVFEPSLGIIKNILKNEFAFGIVNYGFPIIYEEENIENIFSLILNRYENLDLSFYSKSKFHLIRTKNKDLIKIFETFSVFNNYKIVYINHIEDIVKTYKNLIKQSKPCLVIELF